jgi:signal transduction histidine kinase
MMRHPNRNVFKTVVIVWLTLSIASVLLATVTWLQLSHQLSTARHAFDVQNTVQRVLRLLLDCETGERGFVITGNEAFLEPMEAGVTNLTIELNHLVELTRNDPRILGPVVALRAGVAVLLDRFQGVVETRRRQGLAAAEAIISTNETKGIMDRLREEIEKIRRMPQASVADDGAVARAQLLRAGLTSLIAGVLGIGAGMIAFWLSRLTLEQKERERDLIEAKLQAERNSQEKTIFLANMSHEIRTPMNAILGFSELLESELHDPRHRQYLKSVRSSAGSLLQLINDILDMSKIEAGVMELRPEPTDPREICEFIKTVFTEPTVRKKLKLECEVAEDLPRALLLDRVRLRQILVNLVGNAVKFTDQGGIYLRVKGEHGTSSSHITLTIEVQDTGVGIPPDKMESIFKPFVQAGAHRDKEKQGTGLGLAIVKRLTEAMGGTITAASLVGHGAAFHLRFVNTPVSARLAANEQKLTEDFADFGDLEPALILVVDDNDENCQLIAGMFSGSPHKLEFARNGREAVIKARELRPDLILMDLRMPGLNGSEALIQIRSSAGLEVTPVIAVTASALLEETEVRKTFNGHLRKPFSKHELYAEVSQFLPRQLKPATPPNADPGALTASEEALAFVGPASPELIAELERLLEVEWPGIREGLAINETKAFAEKLQALAEKWPCPALRDYAKGVYQRAELYQVVELEEQLNLFPKFVFQLSTSTPA